MLPDPQVPPSPSAPDNPLLDPAVALSFAAAQTETLRLGAGIITPKPQEARERAS